jgi:serine protease Do
VQSVESGGPADKAGVEAGDIIVKVDGKPVEKSGDSAAASSAAPSRAPRPCCRCSAAARRREISVTVGEFEAERPVRRAQAGARCGDAGGQNALGLAVSDLTDAQKKELRLRGGGVRVDAVDGAAARAGLREGDVVLSIDNVEITDSKQFAGIVAKVEKARAVSVLYRRGEWVNYVVIRPTR